MKNTWIKRVLAGGLSAVMLGSAAMSAVAEGDMANELQAKLSAGVDRSIAVDYVGDQLYTDMCWDSISDQLPEKFDLRDRGVVPGIRSQGNWGTCWGFAAIAASETSLLSEMNMTTEQYLQETGKEMKLSERQLAWFGTNHLPNAEDYAEGEYPYPELIDQEGEGMYSTEEESNPNAARLNGGFMGLASSVFANGTGPVSADEVPYTANNGTSSTAADWSVDESYRFKSKLELEESSILPCPAGRDAEGNYVYNKAGTEAIKSELLAGRGVSIAYHSDEAMDPDVEMNVLRDQLLEAGMTEEEIAVLSTVINDEDDPLELIGKLLGNDKTFIKSIVKVLFVSAGKDLSEISDEELDAILNGDDILETVFKILEMFGGLEGIEKLLGLESDKVAEVDEATRREAAAKLGIDYDEYIAKMNAMLEANEMTYMNPVPGMYAQYTDNQLAQVNHGVCIIGWDDTFPASAFLADHQPPADGAWIVRNSWGSSYGNDGYFYLSYYDKTLCAPETFDFVIDDTGYTKVNIQSYDMMQTASPATVLMEEETPMANVFKIDEDCVLSYASLLTTDAKDTATVSVYLLNEDAKDPTDGTMLDTVTRVYNYAGYHRVALNHNYMIPAGSHISIVATHRTMTKSGARYSVPYTTAVNHEYIQLQNTLETNSDYQETLYAVGKINKGESFIQLDGVWTDWKDVIDTLKANNQFAAYLEYDNIALKAYLYDVDEVNALHNFEDQVTYVGGSAQVCSDCGYALMYH